MTISRKVFIGRVSVPPITPINLYTLMKNSSLHWGYESTALTQPSMDSILGSEASIVPDGPVFIGSNNTVSPTTGIAAAGGASFNLQDFGPRGMIDPNQIWFYSQSGSGMAVTFQAR